jgi:hypothetical protein
MPSTFYNPSTLVGVLLTFFIFSFLYKDNPFYRFAEYLLVGVSMGYVIPATYNSSFIPYCWVPIILQHRYILILPSLLGALYMFRFSRNLNWLSRYPIAFGLGLTGMGIPLSLNAQVLVQMRGAMQPLESVDMALIFIGTVSILLYFFFSKAHTGIYKRFCDIGIWFMMIGFGASFGYTVMARISLLIGRIQFQMTDWLGFLK